MIVALEARITQFEKNFAKANRTASKNWQAIEDRGAKASKRLDAHLSSVSASALNAGRSLTGFAASFAAGGVLAGIASFAGAIGKARSAISDFDKIAKTARTAGLGSAFYQSLGFAATEASVSQESLNSALLSFARNAGMAATGHGEIAEKLKVLNPELLKVIVNAKTQEERLRAVADAIQRTATASDRAALSAAVFGDAGVDLVRIFGGGSAALDDFARRARELGLIVDDQLLTKAEALETRLGVLSQVIDTNLNEALVSLAPLLVRASEAVATFARDLKTIADDDLFKFLGALNDELDSGKGIVDAATTAWNRLSREGPGLAQASQEAGEKIERLETSIGRLEKRLTSLREAQARGDLIPRGSIENTEGQILRLRAEVDKLRGSLDLTGKSGVSAAQAIADAMASSASYLDELRRHEAHLAQTRYAGTGGATAAPALTGKLADLDAQFGTALQRFIDAAKEAGHAIEVTSGRRSVERQAELFAQAVAKYGSEAEARRWVAPPGKSFHNLGEAADLKFADEAAREWAHTFAAQFGLAFPLANEAWHIEPANLRGAPAMGDPDTSAADARARDEAAQAAERQRQAIERVVEALRSERDALSATTKEVEINRRLKEAGVTAESADGQRITAEVEALWRAKTAQAAREQQQAVAELVASLRFEQDQLSRTAEEQAVYNALQQAGVSASSAAGQAIAAEVRQLYAKQEALKATEAAQQAANEAAAELNSLGKDSLGGFLKDLAHGASLADALANAVSRLTDRLIDLALNAVFPSPGSLSAGGGGGKGKAVGQALATVMTGAPIPLASGGYVTGPGTGTSDSVPAQLSNGEFVVNAKATRRNRALLDAINSGNVPAFAAGGFVGSAPAIRSPALSAPRGGDQNITIAPRIDVRVEGGSRGPDADKKLGDDLAARMDKTVRGLVAEELHKQMRPGNLLYGRR
ncbi:D-alanyl-D-alanine carboxypeptidase family protein [Propylenella binzhouense]|uniref:D-alanyl-D-alanine carboxypeptidase family protein n=1 Tax=Propylenella binzhouense TaxID=2555902 RepID=UPI00136AE76B|nr:D-alanyl-D-alanine carboxypeptidase family protein [Propylenella binzhouense]